MDDDAIRLELASLAESRPELRPIRSLIGVSQYRQSHRLMREHVPPGAAVLDWGCGAGHFSYFLCHAGYRATGYSFESFAFAAWLGGMPYTFVPAGADPVRLPFADGSFDAVASVGVLEHVRETGGTEAGSLAEIARVLRPGGVFVCTHFPNRASIVDFAAAFVPDKHTHRFKYAAGDIRRLLRDAGLSLVTLRRYGILPRSSASRLPRPLRRSAALAAAWNVADDLLGIALAPLCQNFGFVAKKE